MLFVLLRPALRIERAAVWHCRVQTLPHSFAFELILHGVVELNACYGRNTMTTLYLARKKSPLVLLYLVFFDLHCLNGMLTLSKFSTQYSMSL